MSGSWIGASEQLHGVTNRARCSGPGNCTGWSRAKAVPGALVPTTLSLQSAPGRKCMASARDANSEAPRPRAAGRLRRPPRPASPGPRCDSCPHRRVDVRRIRPISHDAAAPGLGMPALRRIRSARATPRPYGFDKLTTRHPAPPEPDDACRRRRCDVTMTTARGSRRKECRCPSSEAKTPPPISPPTPLLSRGTSDLFFQEPRIGRHVRLSRLGPTPRTNRLRAPSRRSYRVDRRGGGLTGCDPDREVAACDSRGTGRVGQRSGGGSGRRGQPPRRALSLDVG